MIIDTEEKRILHSFTNDFVHGSFLQYLKQSSISETLFYTEDNILFILKSVPSNHFSAFLTEEVFSNPFGEKTIMNNWDQIPEDIQFRFYEHVNHFSLEFAYFLRETVVADAPNHTHSENTIHEWNLDRCYKCHELCKTFSGLPYYDFPDRGEESIQPFARLISSNHLSLEMRIAVSFLNRNELTLPSDNSSVQTFFATASNVSLGFHEWRKTILRKNGVKYHDALYWIIKATIVDDKNAVTILERIIPRWSILEFFEKGNPTKLTTKQWDRLLSLMPKYIVGVFVKYLHKKSGTKTAYFYEVNGKITVEDLKDTYIFPSPYSVSAYNPYFFLKKYGDKITEDDNVKYRKVLLEQITSDPQEVEQMINMPWGQLKSITESTLFV